MTQWKKVFIGLLMALVLLCGAVIVLLATTPGLHLVLNSASRWVPGLHIDNVEGGWRDLRLTGVTYRMPGVSVNGGELHFALRPGCFKQSAFCLDDLLLKDVSVVVNTDKLSPSTTPPQDDKPLPTISTPYPVTLQRLALRNVNVSVDGMHISLNEFTSGLHWQGHALTILPTHLQGLQVALPETATKPPAVTSPASTPKNSPADGLKALFSKPLVPRNSVTLPLDVTVQQLTAEQIRLTGDSDIVINQATLQAKTQGSLLRITTFKVDSPQGQLNVAGQAELAGQWPIALTVNGSLNGTPLKGEHLQLNLHGALQQQVKLALTLAGPLALKLDASAQPATPGLPLDILLTSAQLRWPLSGSAQYQAEKLSYHLTGKASDYSMTLQSRLSGEALPPAALALKGDGNLQQFSLRELSLATLQGIIKLHALVDWSKAVSWQGELTLNGINTAKQYPNWPTTLNGKMAVRGSLYGGSWQLRVPALTLNGHVRQNVISAEGTLYANSYNQWHIPALNLILGRNRLNVSGELGKTMRLDADIDAQHMDNVLPGLAGSVKGKLEARGTLKAPQLLTTLQGSNLRWQGVQVGSAALFADITSDEQIRGKAAVRVTQLKQNSLTINQLALDAAGDEKQHQLKLRVEGEPVAGQLALNGHFDRAALHWQATLHDTQVSSPVGQWRLSPAMAIDYLHRRQTATVGAHCWLNPDAEICVPQPMTVGPQGQARLALNRLDLHMLAPFLPPQTKLAGVFSGDANVSWKNTVALPEGQIRLQGKGVRVTQRVQENKLPVAFETLNLNAALRSGQAQLDWLVRLVNNGQWEGNVNIGDLQHQRTLSGAMNLRSLSLAMLNPALAEGEKIRGILNSELRFAGALQQPQIFGQARLQGVDVEGDFMPVDMTSASLTMLFNGMSSTLEGVLQTAQGQLALHGDANWRQPTNWQANLAAKGNRIRVTVPPMVRMDVSPDLTFNATPLAFNLTGRVDVPWARFTVQEVPESAVGVSSDEVMLNNTLQPMKPEHATVPINSNLTIHIGDNVRLSAFGLKARLNGDLKLAQDKHGLGLNGQVNIPSGRFHAYGQDLVVRKGELQFAGAADQPYINLEAIRNPEATEDGVTAGLRVTGLADEPKAEVFSDPAMSQQEALSYLLRGQGLSSGDDGNAVTSALLSLGLAQSGQVVGKIGETFGIHNLALDTAGVGDSQQVQVSGYILPGLQVKYGVGIFDSLATLTLRYRLMPKLYLEAVSGIDQALDLLYQFEF